MTCIFGIDIVKGSVHGRGRPKYALFIVNEGEKEKIVSKAKLFRLIRQYKPSIVSVDNISELFSSKEELIKFLKEIPPTTKLVQVAGKHSLPYLAKRYGLRMDIRNPMDEAKACALLAGFGVGEEVSVFVDKTLIVVSRNRSLGKGGWRQNKYRRRIHDEVRRVYNEIKSKLDELGFEYVEDRKKGYGGISRGVLLVNAPKEAVPINSFKTRDVQVRVEAVEKERIEFIPLKQTKAYTIVGVDPGTTTAIAVLDLSGNLLGVSSRKEWSSSEVVDYILSFGKPVVIATDKSSPPDFVSKLRASFNAVLYTPKEDMSVDKKKTLASKYKVLNDHERDALAAAMEAYNSYKNKLLNIEKRIPSGYDVDAIKAGIIKGLTLRELLGKKKEVKVKEEKPPKEQREDSEKRENLIRELEEENRILKEEVEKLREEIERLRARIVSISREEHERIRKDNYIRSLEAEIAELRAEIKERDRIIEDLKERVEQLRSMKLLEFSGWKGVKVLTKFTREEIEKLEREIGIEKGDVIYIHNPGGGGRAQAEYLCSRGVKAIIASNVSHTAMAVFEEMEVPVIGVDEVDIKVSDNVAVLKTDRFEEIYRKKVEEMNRKKLERVEQLIFEYKQRRSMR
ncbi:DUF460 domain-containing protein [Archaeoglobus veneficus]|uniref:DUF460 domain-containing protein n=1 Tax=Archaeoglobus veneficus (strain DSM 11195 / SNP6) TaxID=693661 RepID=F2KQA2_ARCVS|nr:DUF460 domain-containing protein [Archaeoglobus veneficus]AEA46535.1 protein of unknown function DUF460 [Archaeoglobus veneficus SNP6]